MPKCICGFESQAGKFGAHTKTCQGYQTEKIRLQNIDRKYIVSLYKEKYSLTQSIKELRENYNLGDPVIRSIVTGILKEEQVFEGVGGKNTQKQKQKRIQNTMMERYGVINAGQLDGNGFKHQNNIKYNKLKISSDLELYKKQSNRIARKYLEKCRKNNSIPESCHYTKIKFNDELLEAVNPNDPFKRTIDHRIPVVEMFLKGKSPEETSHPDNLVFCLRIVNTYKANSSEEYFLQEVLPYLKERLSEN